MRRSHVRSLRQRKQRAAEARSPQHKDPTLLKSTTPSAAPKKQSLCSPWARGRSLASSLAERGDLNGFMAYLARGHLAFYTRLQRVNSGRMRGGKSSVEPSLKTKLCAMPVCSTGSLRKGGIATKLGLPWTCSGEK